MQQPICGTLQEHFQKNNKQMWRPHHQHWQLPKSWWSHTSTKCNVYLHSSSPGCRRGCWSFRRRPIPSTTARTRGTGEHSRLHFRVGSAQTSASGYMWNLQGSSSTATWHITIRNFLLLPGTQNKWRSSQTIWGCCKCSCGCRTPPSPNFIHHKTTKEEPTEASRGSSPLRAWKSWHLLHGRPRSWVTGGNRQSPFVPHPFYHPTLLHSASSLHISPAQHKNPRISQEKQTHKGHNISGSVGSRFNWTSWLCFGLLCQAICQSF